MPVLLTEFEIEYLNPIHHGYPAWPGKNRYLQLFRTMADTQVVSTKGLSDGNGLNYEIYLETNDLIEPDDFSSSWQANLVYETGKIIPRVTNLSERLKTNQYLSLQIEMEGAPEEWSMQNENGNIGLFIGLNKPSMAELTAPAVPLNIKLMRPQELQYSIEQGQEGRHHLAKLYAQQGNVTISSLDRNSVI